MSTLIFEQSRPNRTAIAQMASAVEVKGIPAALRRT